METLADQPMLLGRRTVAHYVDDLGKARRGITDLVGRAPYFDEPYYTGFDVCRYELGVLPDMVSVGTYWAVDDLERERSRDWSASLP
ncbi:MAG: hypothetical protein ING75_12510 [Rhodocyclaceae bacterium]|nr:hypothetical protein [Rhodocyclaceae bacterium]